MNSGIYQILNKVNGKFYIGSAVHFVRRFSNHKRRLRHNSHDNPKLQAAWNFYGEMAFEFSILEYCAREDLLTKEQFWFDWCKPEYNILKIAGSSIGHKHSEEFKRKRSELYTGRKQSAELVEKRIAPLRGRKISNDHRAKLKLAKLNQSVETRRKIGLKHKGKTISLEHRKVVSEAAKRLAIKRKADILTKFSQSLENEIKWQKPQE